MPLPPESGYDRLFNLSFDLLCIAGLDGYFKRVNPSWTRVLGWSEAELLSRPVESFMHPEDRERTLEARKQLARGEPVRELENRYLCKDGSHRWLSWQSVVEPGASTVFAIARDITERRQREHEQLVMSKLESTGILAGGIAHDFNNLLAGLLLNLEMVSACGATSAEQDGFLQQARQSVHAAKALTQQLLAFADGGVASRRIVEVKGLLRRTLELALGGGEIRGECVLAPDLWPADIDEALIGQAVRSLVLNAREATPAGGTVRLVAENTTLAAAHGAGLPAGDYLCIRIMDAGAGMPRDVLARAFDPYFSTKQRGTQKGMGLGLTIARTAIRQHGGAIAVDSTPGGGTTVTCYLPAARAEAAAVPVEPRTDAPAPAAPAARAAVRVLVMDDEPFFREIVVQTLRGLGYDVAEAEEGERAVELYADGAKAGRPFGVVLLDLTVRGGMGGTAALERLHAIDPGVRAVLMTGYTNEQTFRDPARHGFCGALSKPFSREALRSVLDEILRTYPLEADGGGV